MSWGEEEKAQGVPYEGMTPKIRPGQVKQREERAHAKVQARKPGILEAKVMQCEEGEE